MIIYLDTSSLVKLYVEESGSAEVRAWVEDAELVATCRIAYPETISALTRRFRSGDVSKKDYALLLDALLKDWRSYVVVDFDELEAGHLVRKYGLRGFDAVHLSSAKLIRGEEEPDLFFSSFDRGLNTAARAEGFKLPEMGGP